MNLFLDDTRPAPDGYTLFETAEQLIMFLGTNWNKVKIISLDHDLGDDRMTGYDVIRFIEEELHTDGGPTYVPFEIYIHSANSVGHQNMERGLRAIRKRENELRPPWTPKK